MAKRKKERTGVQNEAPLANEIISEVSDTFIEESQESVQDVDAQELDNVSDETTSIEIQETPDIPQVTLPSVSPYVTPPLVAEPEVRKNCRYIVANTKTPYRKLPTMEPKHIVGQMPLGLPIEIVRTVTSRIYGDFYLLANGRYISTRGNYTMKE